MHAVAYIFETFSGKRVVHVQGTVTINLAAITNENVYTTQAMDAQLYIRVGSELIPGAEQNMADTHNLLSLHVACRHRF